MLHHINKRIPKGYHKPFWITIGLLAVMGVYFFVTHNVSTAPTNDKTTTEISTNPFEEIVPDTTPTSKLPESAYITGVPFTSQAPFGDWKDPRQQDGCEEAGILMAAYWAQGKTSITQADALHQILALSAKAEEMFGTYHDSSAEDTLKLYNAYFKLDGEVKANPAIDEIKKALAAGKVVGVPTDGRKLGNPNFTGAGPDRHFIVIIGYDDTKGVFTTDDPGTHNGSNYKYKYDTLMGALLNYPTGDHAPLFKQDTAMIVFKKA